MNIESERNDQSAVKNPVFETGEFEWIEKAAIENLKQRVECADVLAKEAGTTLTILLAGIGGSLVFAVKVLDADYSSSVLAATAVCGWLTLWAIVLVFTCLKINEIYIVYNEPKNLLKRTDGSSSFTEWRIAELNGMQFRIEKNIERNDKTAFFLNLVRGMTAITPLVALLGLLPCW